MNFLRGFLSRRWILLPLPVLALGFLACDPVNYTADHYSDDVRVQVVKIERRSDNAPFVITLKNRTKDTFRYLGISAVCYDAGTATKPGLATPPPNAHTTVGSLESGKKITLRPYSTQAVIMKGVLAKVDNNDKVYCDVVEIDALKTVAGGF